MLFSVDDIHRLRLETAERYSNMTKEEARRDLRARAENTRRAIEEMRRLRRDAPAGQSPANRP